MIVSYKDKRTQSFADGDGVSAFEAFRRQAGKRLAVLDSAADVADLQGLPSNRLEALRGGRTGQWSIRINLQWRICFAWLEGAPGPANVEIVDYH